MIFYYFFPFPPHPSLFSLHRSCISSQSCIITLHSSTTLAITSSEIQAVSIYHSDSALHFLWDVVLGRQCLCFFTRARTSSPSPSPNNTPIDFFLPLLLPLYHRLSLFIVTTRNYLLTFAPGRSSPSRCLSTSSRLSPAFWPSALLSLPPPMARERVSSVRVRQPHD